MTDVFPLRVLIDLWLWERCLSEGTGSAGQKMDMRSVGLELLEAGDALPPEDLAEVWSPLFWKIFDFGSLFLSFRSEDHPLEWASPEQTVEWLEKDGQQHSGTGSDLGSPTPAASTFHGELSKSPRAGPILCEILSP